MLLGFSRRNVVRHAAQKSRRPALKRRRLAFDCLEDRRLLSAGTVDISPAQTFAVASYPPGNTAPSNTLDPATVAWTSNHAAAMDSKGDTVVVWDDSPTNPTTHQVTGQWTNNFQLYTEGTNATTGATQLNAGAGGPLTDLQGNVVTTDEGSPMVAMAPTSGEFVVVWESQSVNSYGYTGDSTYAQLYSATGAHLTSPILVGQAGLAELWGVAMSDNGFDVVYGGPPAHYRNNGPDYQIITVERYSNTGATLGSPISVVNESNVSYAASISADPAGNFVVGWSNSNGVYSLNWQRYTSAGNTAEGAQQEVTTDFPSQVNLAMDSSDDFVMTWHDGGSTDVPAGLYAQTVYANDTLGSQSLVDGSAGGDRTAIAMQPAGNYALSWYDGAASNYSPNPYAVYAATYALAGTPETAPFVVYSAPAVTVNGQTHGLDHTASAALDPSGNLLTVNAGYYTDNTSTVYTDGGEFGQLYLAGSQAVPTSGFAVSAPANVTVGVPFNITVTAEDANGNTASSFNGTVALTDSNGISLGNVTLTNGVGTAKVTLNATGSDTLTANGTDPNTGNPLSGSSTLTVYGQASQFVFSAAVATAGTALRMTLTAEDSNGNLAGGYAGPVQLSTSDVQAVMPSKVTLTNGMATFTVTLKTAGSQTITATDNNLTSTDTISVAAAAASKFIISAPSSVSSGSPFSVTVEVEDAYGNVVTGYTGTVHFSLSGGSGSLPADYTFTAADQGIHTFTGLTLTAGHKNRQQSDTIVVTDTKNSSITGSVVVSV